MTKRAKHTRARYAAERGRNRERVRTRRQPRRSMSCCCVAALPLSTTTTTTPRRDAEHRRWQRNSAVLCEGCVCLCASLLILHCILILRARISHSIHLYLYLYLFMCVCGVAYSYKLQNSVQFFIARYEMSHGEDASLSATSFRSSSYKRVNNLRKAHDDNSVFFLFVSFCIYFQKTCKEKKSENSVRVCVCAREM